MTVSDVVSRAVRKMTGTSLSPARRRRTTSKPSMSGSMMSSTIRSGRPESASRSASFPVAAVVTAHPWNLSATWTSSRMLGSSSTTSTLGICSSSVIGSPALLCPVIVPSPVIDASSAPSAPSPESPAARRGSPLGRVCPPPLGYREALAGRTLGVGRGRVDGRAHARQITARSEAAAAPPSSRPCRRPALAPRSAVPPADARPALGLAVPPGGPRKPPGFAVAAAPVRSKFTAFSGYDLNGLDQTRR